jgi:predicted RNA methylase
MPKFIHWVPTEDDDVDNFFKIAPLSAADVVFDLGSGDGKLLFAAVEKGAGKCVGIDIDPERVKVARKAAKNKGLDTKITFIEADVVNADLSDATVIFCYLFPTASAALRPKFEKELKPGTRVVIEQFPVPGWEPVEVIENGIGRRFLLYVMPAEKTADYDQAVKDWGMG